MRASLSSRTLPILFMGLLAGTLAVMQAVSFASLIFSGPLASLLVAGIGAALLCGALVPVVVSWTSSFPGSVAVPASTPAIVLSLLAAGIAQELGSAGDVLVLRATVFAAIILCTLGLGLFFLAIGAFRLGEFVRYIPYPVIGGFVAGVGWLVVLGGVGVMARIPVHLSTLPALLAIPDLLRWGPALAATLLVVWLRRRINHYLVLPGALVGAALLFYAGMWGTGHSTAALMADGWLLGPFPNGEGWSLAQVLAIRHADLAVLAHHTPDFATLLVVSLVTFLLYASGVEVAVGADLRLNQELVSTGAANVLSAMGGGMAGYMVPSITILSARMGAANRAVGMISGALCALVLFWGLPWFGYVPRPVVGALLASTGLEILLAWIYDAFPRLPRADYGIVLLILASVAGFGYLPGIGVGIVAGIILFVVNYSRVNVVRHAFSGAEYPSNVDRPEGVRRLLRSKGEQIHVLKLQGFLFFGTANRLLETVRRRAQAGAEHPLRYLILDFRQVHGLDSSAAISFVKMGQLAQRDGFTIVASQCAPELHRQLSRGGFSSQANPRLREAVDLQHALEWCEDDLLSSEARAGADFSARPLWSYLEEALGAVGGAERLRAEYLERIQAPEGAVLIEQGAPAEDLFFIETGRLRVELRHNGSPPVHIRTLGPGTVVGEVAWYLRIRRSAWVTALEPSVLHRMSAESLRRMKSQSPDLAAAFHEFMCRMLAERLVNTNKLLEQVLD